MDAQAVPHPARFTDQFLPVFAELLANIPNVLDPFAGTGKLAHIKDHGYTGEVYLNELEREWAMQAPAWATVTMNDAEHLPYPDNFFGAVCTSPTYGNRMADHCEWQDTSKRITYKSVLGRGLSTGNTGAMQWGADYRSKHARIWAECARALKPEGLLILNISDHIRHGQVMPVTDWHISCLGWLGFEKVEHRRIETPRMGFGANGKARADHESILVFRLHKPSPKEGEEQNEGVTEIGGNHADATV